MEKIFNKRIEECSIEELIVIQSKIINEITKKKRFEEEKSWRKVVDALKEYIEIYGTIEINFCGEIFYIDANTLCDEIGHIRLY